MKTIKCLAAIVLFACLGGCAFLANQTVISPGDTFLLGGDQRQPLLIEGKNVGSIPVEISRQANGHQTLLLVAQPGQKFSQTLAAGEIARFRNISSANPAHLKFDLTPEVAKLSMQYVDPGQAK
jgi:hypothetical protein